MPKYLKTTLTVAGILAFFVFLGQIFKVTAPFLLAFCFAAASQRLIRLLENKLKINRGVWAAVLIGLVILIFGGLITFLIWEVVKQLKSLINALPAITDSLRGGAVSLGAKFGDILGRISPELSRYSDSLSNEIWEAVQQTIAPLTDGALNTAKNVALSLPNIIIFIITFLIASFFMSKDYRLIINFLKDALPDKAVQKLRYLKTTVFDTFFSYAKAQGILMCITFAIVSVVLWILDVSYPILIGAGIGVVDALPFFGAGTVLVPWVIAEIIFGNYSLAVSLAALWVICFLVRQILEPKILSSQIGIHPLLTIFSVYVGLKIFGVPGILIGPVIMVIAVNLYTLSRLNRH